jgi:hypothetical protein
MIKQLPKLLLLVTLLTTLVMSALPTFANSGGCLCNTGCWGCKGGGHTGGCHFDTKSSQCVNTGCPGLCQL